MTNAEKYKTAHERAEGFNRYCMSFKECQGCKIQCRGAYDNKRYYVWLELEAEEEMPLPCPFCGSKDIRTEMVKDNSDGYTTTPQIICGECGATQSLETGITEDLGYFVTYEMRQKLISKWNNRVTKAVKESEVDQ